MKQHAFLRQVYNLSLQDLFDEIERRTEIEMGPVIDCVLRDRGFDDEALQSCACKVEDDVVLDWWADASLPTPARVTVDGVVYQKVTEARTGPQGRVEYLDNAGETLVLELPRAIVQGYVEVWFNSKGN